MKRNLAALLLLAGFTAPPTALDPGGHPEAATTVRERLVYQVEWNPPWYLFFLPTMEAGEAELAVEGEMVHKGRKALKIVFRARSSGTLVRLAGVAIDDHFEFLSDPETLCTFAVHKKIQEGKRKREIAVTYLPAERALHIRETDLAVSPPKVRRDETVRDIAPCVQDLFSALHSVRRKEFADGVRHRATVGDNARVKEVEVRVLGSEEVATPQGRYETWKLETVALLGGLFKEGGHFIFWLSKDERHLPVRFEAKVNLGKVTGKLKQLER